MPPKRLGTNCIPGLMLLTAFTGCAKDDTPPVFRNLPINISAYDSNTQKAGDIDFTHTAIGNTGKWFMEFAGNHTYDMGGGAQGGATSAHYKFRLPSGKPIYSMLDGVVIDVVLNDKYADYEIRLAPNDDSVFRIVYDHVMNPKVASGNKVTAGQQIGDTTTEAVELEVDVSSQESGLYICPTDYFAADVASGIKATLTQLMTDIETFRGNTSLYNEASAANVGCASGTLGGAAKD